MIVQCKKCETKFRFDEAIISGEGVWVRCSVCKNTFFQDNPRKEEKGALPPENAVKDREPATLEEEPVVVTEKRAARVKVFRPGAPDTEPLHRAPADGPDESFPDDDEEESLPDAGRRRGGVLKVLPYLLFIILIIGGVCLWLFPPFSGQVLTEWVSSVPFVDRIIGMGGGQHKDFGIDQVKIQDLKQRVVKNMLLGDLRVIEGMALNQSEYEISGIQVRGRVYDAGGVVLSERISSCGNVLTDEELASMTEDDMQKVFSLPQGRNASSDRITANVRIPFMIVFANVPPGMEKITVLPAGAERLLP